MTKHEKTRLGSAAGVIPFQPLCKCGRERHCYETRDSWHIKLCSGCDAPSDRTATWKLTERRIDE